MTGSAADMVSVCMITYNHGKYISQAIEGVLMQKTSFPIELIIGEDCSKDNTRNICLEYQTKYPGIIKVLPTDGNKGILNNFSSTLLSCSGKYIAICEGDDYWTDLDKLQSQYEFLEKNEEYVATFHDVVILDEINSNRNNLFAKKNITSLFEAYSNFVPTCSLFFRNKNIIDLFQPTLHPEIIGGDKLLLIGLASLGKLHFIDIEMAVYRINSGGISILINNEKKAIGSIYTNKFLLSKLQYKEIWSAARKSLLILYGNLAVLHFSNRKYYKYLKYLIMALFQIRKIQELKIIISDFLFMKPT